MKMQLEREKKQEDLICKRQKDELYRNKEFLFVQMKEKERRLKMQREAEHVEASRMIEQERKVLELEKKKVNDKKQQNHTYQHGLI